MSDALKTVLDNMLNLTFHPDVSQEIKPSYDLYQIHADNLYVVAIMHNSKNPVGWQEVNWCLLLWWLSAVTRMK